MRKKYFLLCAILFIAQTLIAQTSPMLSSQRNFGGKMNDAGRVIRRTADKGFIVAANTSSTTVPGFHGITDIWIKKFNRKGKVEWSKCYGGSDADYVTTIESTGDNGYIISGSTTSNDGDVAGKHGIGYDAWVIKIDAAGTIQWSKCYGGNDYDDETVIIPTDDGGYIFAASSESLDGDAAGIAGYGGTDVWIVKISSAGAIEWQKKYGGADGDFAGSIKRVPGGGYIIGGGTYSYLPGKFGDGMDSYLIRITNTGDLVWQNTYGGSSEEGYAMVTNTPDGGFVFTASATSNNGDVSGVHNLPDADEFYIYDVWLVKLSSAGVIEWQKCFGGIDNDYGQDVQKTSDGGYIVCGTATSVDGDVTGNHGGADAWIIKTSVNGTLEWQLTSGGSLHEYGSSITPDFNGGRYLFTGSSSSADGDCTDNNGLQDLWVAQLEPVSAIATTINESSLVTKTNTIGIHPNPVQSMAFINFKVIKAGNYSIILNDVNGKQVLRKEYKTVAGENKLQVDVAALPKGIYFIKLQQGSEIIAMEKLIKQ